MPFIFNQDYFLNGVPCFVVKVFPDLNFEYFIWCQLYDKFFIKEKNGLNEYLVNIGGDHSFF